MNVHATDNDRCPRCALVDLVVAETARRYPLVVSTTEMRRWAVSLTLDAIEAVGYEVVPSRAAAGEPGAATP